MGHKIIKDGDGEATLIAVSVRNPKNSLEWAGNMAVGKGALHEGFREARDETLRYLKKYISDQNISGRLKLWICGQGHGGAVSNLTAAYFADGGYGYFEGVTIAPEDVYSYTFGSTRTVVKNKLTKGEAGRVGAARTDKWYEADTPGEEYAYSGEDASEVIDNSAEQYRGIHNYRDEGELMSQMPAEDWEFELFGADNQLDISGKEDEVLNYLKAFGKEYADSYQAYVSEEKISKKMLDTETLSFVDDPSGGDTISKKELYKSRVEGILSYIGSQEDYVDKGYEKALTGLAGIYGVAGAEFRRTITENEMTLLKAGLYTYAGYVKQWYKTEMEQELSDGEAMAVAVSDLLGYVTGEEIDPNSMTIDELLYVMSKYVVDQMEPQYDPDHPDDLKKVTGFTYSSKAAKLLFRLLGKQVEDMIMGDNPDAELYSLLVKCAYGKIEDKGKVSGPEAGKKSRSKLLSLVSVMISTVAPDLTDEAGSITVRRYFDATGSLFLSGKSGNGKAVQFESLEAAADAILGNMFRKALKTLIESGKIAAEGAEAEILSSYVDDIIENTGALREILYGLLLYMPGDTLEFDNQIQTFATVAGQKEEILYSLLPQIYAAQLMALDDLYPCE